MYFIMVGTESEDELSGHIVFIVRRWRGRDGGPKEKEGGRRETEKDRNTERMEMSGQEAGLARL